MKPGITVLWDRETPFKQYLTERGFDCEVVTPKLVAAPFFSWRACRLALVPAGFGNPFFSGGVLDDLRANRLHITDFVKAGGTLLVSGAHSHRDAYNWLPRPLTYVRADKTVKLKRVQENKAARLVETDECMCDGYFDEVDEGWDIVLAMEKDEEEKAILVVLKCGAGEIIATTIHEYPSDRFFEYCVRC